MLLRRESIEGKERELERKRFAMEERIKTMRKRFELEEKEAKLVIDHSSVNSQIPDRKETLPRHSRFPTPQRGRV